MSLCLGTTQEVIKHDVAKVFLQVVPQLPPEFFMNKFSLFNIFVSVCSVVLIQHQIFSPHFNHPKIGEGRIVHILRHFGNHKNDCFGDFSTAKVAIHTLETAGELTDHSLAARSFAGSESLLKFVGEYVQLYPPQKLPVQFYHSIVTVSLLNGQAGTRIIFLGRVNKAIFFGTI